ncbi:E3 SUMO-protein ligase pli1 [Aphelenchoides avenae]|nr:E3 SUMO-protein ligase pli1 [Aphelenchus avenae]
MPDDGMMDRGPAGSIKCKHLQCFDLATYLKEHARGIYVANSLTGNRYVYWSCVICSQPASLHQLRVDEYFESIQKTYIEQIVEEVEVLSDGEHRPAVQAGAKDIEVFDVSGSPSLRGKNTQDNSEVDDMRSVENTGLDLRGIEHLPETNQLCKSVKRELLEDFKRALKRKRKYAPLLHPARDLAQNWDVDLDHLVRQFSQEAASHSIQSGDRFNFAEAALLV